MEAPRTKDAAARSAVMSEPTAADLAHLKLASGLENTPTPLTYQYRIAMGGDGPHAATWADKPHRLIYDLCRHIESLAAASPTGRQLGPGKRDELPPIVSEGVERDAYIRELEGALEPFAKAGERFDRSVFRGPVGGPYGPMPDSECVAGITIGSLRRARSALSKATGEGG